MTSSSSGETAARELTATTRLEIIALHWPEVRDGDDLAGLLLTSMAPSGPADGDVVAITSKVVSKAEGRAAQGDRRDAVASESVRVVARRGDSVIAETRHGLVLAAAGVDASNTAVGTALLLPLDPDESARRLRAAVLDRTGRNVGVIITDTAGRAWRNGQIDLAVGCAGVAALTDLSGTTDPYGNVLVVTAPATADEIASAADLVKGKCTARPVAVLRGLGARVLPPGQHGAGARELVRPSELDLFGLGSRESAVTAALRHDEVALAHFPPTVPVDEPPLSEVVSEDPLVRVSVTPAADSGGWILMIEVREDAGPEAWLHAGRLWERYLVIAAAYRLAVEPVDGPDGGAATPASSTRAHAWQRVLRIRCSVA